MHTYTEEKVNLTACFRYLAFAFSINTSSKVTKAVWNTLKSSSSKACQSARKDT